MSQLDTPLRLVAKSVLRRFGTDLTLTAVSYGTYSVTSGATTRVTAATSLQGFLSEYRPYELSDSVLAGDRKLLIAASALSATPTSEDTVTIGSTTYRIIGVRPYMSGDQAALIEVQLRGAA
jgi:hypothetical protein